MQEKLAIMLDNSLSSFLLRLSPYDALVESEFAKQIKQYKAGVYYVGVKSPFLLPGEKYLVQVGQVEHEIKGVDFATRTMKFADGSVAGFNDDIRHVYNPNGEICCINFRKTWLRGVLSSTPTVPIFGQAVIKAYVQDILDSVQIHKKTPRCTRNLEEVYREYMHPAACVQISFPAFSNIVEELLADIWAEVTRWTGQLTWDFLSEIRETSRGLLIKNNGDWRIHEWNNRHATEFFTGHPERDPDEVSGT